jgi:hypothetical protein
MPIRLHNLRVSFDRGEDVLPARSAEMLGLPADRVESVRTVRRALDARPRRPVWVYTVDVRLGPGVDEAAVAEQAAAALVAEPEEPGLELSPGDKPLGGRPVVVGAGPAGLFTALVLAEYGYRPLVVERGRSVPQRARDIDALFRKGKLDPESNLLFGLGGAGTWSDGKLNWKTSDPLACVVLHTLISCGAPEQIAVDANPHVGTDVLRGVVTRLAEHICETGGEFQFGARADALVLRGGRAAGVRCGGERTDAGVVVLAVGHSARDTFEVLADQGVALEPRPFQVGVRIEHPQEHIDRAQYGPHAGHSELPPAEYTLRHKARGRWRSVHSFCMCPGGMVVPAMSEQGHVCTNGMSESSRAGAFANAALVVPVGPKDFGTGSLDGVTFQKRIEQAAFGLTGSLSAPAQRASAFVADRTGPPPERTSYPLGVTPCRFSRILPKPVYQSIVRALAITFDRKIPGFAGDDAVVLGPESRVSPPIRVIRDERTRESVSTPGLFPAGEGSGYAGGIVSSAVDGIQTARALIQRYAPPG